ncbi:MAG: MarR family transcriptional regulator [Deltaproteobacteria bacterium]|nr:MarR family transcriptional regulator [Deltaproteobacteria bacterium]
MFRLDESLGFLLNRAAIAMRWALEERLVRYGLTAPQWAILARLWEEDGQSPSVMGKSLHFDKPTATGIIDRLEQKVLVKKTRDPEDRRVIRVYLTGKGRELQKHLPQFASEVNQMAFRGMKNRDIKFLKAHLRKIWDNFRM